MPKCGKCGRETDGYGWCGYCENSLRWLKWLGLMALLIVAQPVEAHKADSGMVYDHECCHDTDCAEVIQGVRNFDGSLTVTTKHGKATFPKDYPMRESKDGKFHACFTPSKLYCLYGAAGI